MNGLGFAAWKTGVAEYRLQSGFYAAERTQLKLVL